MKRSFRTFATLAAAAAIVASPVVIAATAHAGPYAPTPVTVSTTHPSAGGQVHVVASGFKPNSSVQVSIHSAPVLLATTTADANGNIDVTVTVPSGFTPGSAHQIVASGVDPSGAQVSDTVNITLAGGSGSLPFTGADVLAIGVAGVALVGVGGFLLFAARWKRRAVLAE
jgi:hypothetical protein